jgi:8-oxo-dGTP diphosphatase
VAAVVEEGVLQEAAGVAALSVVRAAGGVVWRRRSGPGFDVLLVHRPKYDDWTLPKGKAENDESDEECARREVEEETGLRCSLGPELESADYIDRHDRPKHVRYWAMKPLGGTFTPNDEVDEARWVPLDVAVRLLSYQRDAEVLTGLREAVGR